MRDILVREYIEVGEMKVIYSKEVGSGGVVRYRYFDTSSNTKGIVYRNNLIYGNSVDFYGIKINCGRIKNTGYKSIPLYNVNAVGSNVLYTLLGKIVLNGEKCYLLIGNNDAYIKLSELDVLKLNRCGKIVNVVNSDKLVRLRTGQIPKLSVNRVRNKKDTVVKISDIGTDTPSPGVAKKFIGRDVKTGLTGVVKYTVVPSRNDNINEVLYNHLGKLLGVNVCGAMPVIYSGDDNWVLSVFEYNRETESISSCRRIFGTNDFYGRFNVKNINKMFGKDAVDNFNRMVILDSIAFQEDRHISNFSFIKDDLYALYDNGRCLFWDKTDSVVNDLSKGDILSLIPTNEHGYGINYIIDMLGYNECRRLITNNVSKSDLYKIVVKFYNRDRAVILSNMMYRVYKTIMHY